MFVCMYVSLCVYINIAAPAAKAMHNKKKLFCKEESSHRNLIRVWPQKQYKLKRTT